MTPYNKEKEKKPHYKCVMYKLGVKCCPYIKLISKLSLSHSNLSNRLRTADTAT